MRGAAAASENITWSTSTWPQPNRLLSTIRTDASRPAYSATSQLTQSRVSLLRPVAVRTISPSTTRLTEVSSERGCAGSAPSTRWSTVRWPQPPVASSCTWNCASRPGELRDIPRLPVELARLGAGRRAHDLAVDEEPHLERAVEPLAAADEEREVVLAGLDRERRRGEVAEVVVALRAALPGVDALLAQVVVAAGCRRIAARVDREVARRLPARVGERRAVGELEAVEQQAPGGRLVAELRAVDVRVVAAADEEVHVAGRRW